MGSKKDDQLLGKSKIIENRSGYKHLVAGTDFIEFEKNGNSYRLRSTNVNADKELREIPLQIREGEEDFLTVVSTLYGERPFDVALMLMEEKWVYALGVGYIEGSLHMVFVFGRPKAIGPNKLKQLVVLFVALDFEDPIQNGIAHGEGGDG